MKEINDLIKNTSCIVEFSFCYKHYPHVYITISLDLIKEGELYIIHDILRNQCKYEWTLQTIR